MVRRVGVIVVHGIGEQRRFEHIDGQVRCIVGAVQERYGKTNVTVEIIAATGAAFQANQDSWSTGATVRIMVREAPGALPIELCFHEVWWADVNEPYSLIKQIRFWLWGLTLWIFPEKMKSRRAAASAMAMPKAGKTYWIWVRLRLFSVAVVAVAGAASVGMITFLAERLLKLGMPDFLRVFVNYVAGVKLYNQKRRLAGTVWPTNLDVLDTIGEPPRVSIRRRMIRAIADVALANYERWYVMAHSLGSVVAFNGLMETAYAWPGYLDEDRWNKLVAQRMAGAARRGWVTPLANVPPRPRRPIWASDNQVVYRRQIFDRFHGLLTFGSPLEKFAAIWPGNVPLSTQPAFRDEAHWINVYDPIDPVSGVLHAFDDGDAGCCPRPQNCGFKAGWVFLVNHLQYLEQKEPRTERCCNTLADFVADWLITGKPLPIDPAESPRFFHPNSATHRMRSFVLWVWWLFAGIALLLLGSVVAPLVIKAVVEASGAIWAGISIFH